MAGKGRGLHRKGRLEGRNPRTRPDDSVPGGFDVADLYHPNVSRSIRQLPGLLGGAVRLVWGAARGQLLLSMALQGVSSAGLAFQVLAGKQLLSRLLADNAHKNFSSAVPWVIALAVALAVVSVVTIARIEVQRLLSEMVARTSMQLVIDAARQADLARFEDPHFHDRLQRAIVNATIRPLQMTTGLLSVGSSALGALGVGIAVITIEPLFFALGIVAAVPLTLSSIRVGRALYNFAVEQTPTDRERTYIQALLVEKDPAKEIRAFELGGFLRARFDALYERRLQALRRLVRRRTAQGVAGGAMTAVMSGGTIALLIVFVSDGRISLAGAGAAAAALLLLGGQLQGMAGGIGQLYESALFIQDFTGFVRQVPTSTQFTGRTRLAARHGKVEARSLTFTYPSRTKPSLIDVDLDIEPGQVVALVGENGSGKTTLAKLLAGLYLPQSGNVRWHGVDLRDLDISELRSRVAPLFQDFVHYFLSARENVGMGRSEFIKDEARVRQAARRSQADDFLQALPRGYDTYLGPQYFGGSDLSGGQWQRVALARAFFRDAELIILDEPTAALDPRAEAALFAAVRELFEGRSVLIISHRFATVRFADAIHVLSDGRVVEHGSHEQLMARNGLYAELFTLQAAALGLSEPAYPTSD